MTEEPNDSPEERRQKIRRKLLKLGVYTAPAIITLLVSNEAFAQLRRCRPKRGRLVRS